MRKLLPITIFSVLMAWLSHRHSEYDPINCKYKSKEKMFYTIMSICLILFAGLRILYNDTVTYMHAYRILLEDTEAFGEVDWSHLGSNPAFWYVQRLMVSMNFSDQTFIMLFTIFVLGTYLWFFRKYSCNLWMTILLFIVYAGFTFALAALKQCTAMALCLIATDRAINKKYLRFVLYVLLASLFHPYALMYLVVPFLFFRPWSAYTLVMIAIFAVIGFGLESMLGGLLNVTDMLGENYDASAFMGEGVNPIRLLVTAIPSIVALLGAKQIAANKERDQYLMVNLTMLNAEIMFVGLFGTANYFGRLANYFAPFQALSLPWLLKHFDQNGKRTMTVFAAMGYGLFFIYSQSIYESFDLNFYSITLWEYLKSLF